MKNYTLSTKHLLLLLITVTIATTGLTVSKIYANYNEVPQMHFPSINSSAIHDETLTEIQSKKASARLPILLQEHAVVGAIAFMKRFDMSPDFEILNQKVQRNTERLTLTIGELYGEQIQDRFKTLWTYHIVLLTDYTDATREQNADKKQHAVNELHTMNDQMAQLFVDNGKLSKEEIGEMIKVHIDQEKGIIDNYATGNEGEVLNLIQHAAHHAQMLANILLQNIQK